MGRKVINLLGQRFTRWLVVAASEERTKYGDGCRVHESAHLASKRLYRINLGDHVMKSCIEGLITPGVLVIVLALLGGCAQQTVQPTALGVSQEPGFTAFCAQFPGRGTCP